MLLDEIGPNLLYLLEILDDALAAACLPMEQELVCIHSNTQMYTEDDKL
jgi:hypothetical protein